MLEKILRAWKLDIGAYIVYPFVIMLYILAFALIIGGAYFL